MRREFEVEDEGERKYYFSYSTPGADASGVRVR
jgi:hypothetical protein